MSLRQPLTTRQFARTSGELYGSKPGKGEIILDATSFSADLLNVLSLTASSAKGIPL
jgi:hypothetical protein